jgi:hypothetical protein
VALLAIGWQAPGTLLQAWLVAWLFLLAVPLGSLALRQIHVLTGGAWGVALRVPLLAGARMLPLIAVLELPLLFGMRWLLPWVADPHAALAGQRWYLEPRFFVVRALACLALWWWLAAGLERRLAAAAPPPRGFAALGLLLLLLSVTVSAVDWVMSLVPRWHSAVLGLLLFTVDVCVAFALATLVRLAQMPAPERVGDLGRWLLTLLLGWGYLAFMDFLTAWVGDLLADTAWYLPRLATDWKSLGIALVIGGLALPFALLLSARVRRSPRALIALAAWLLYVQYIYVGWLLWPSVRPAGFDLRVVDGLAALLAFGLLAVGLRAGWPRALAVAATEAR